MSFLPSLTALGKYLNTTFYNTLDNTYMIDGIVYTNRYDSTVDFDYKGIYASNITARCEGPWEKG